MTREVLHRLVGAGFISVRARDHRARVVRHDQLGHAADEAQGACAPMQPVGHRLARRCAGEGVAGGTERGHKNMRPRTIGEFDRRTGVVDEELLAGAMDLAHRALQSQCIASIPLAELAVAVSGLSGMGGHVLFPEQHEGDALAPQFLMDAAVVGQHVMAPPVQPALHDAAFQRRVAQGLDGGPVQAGNGGQADVLRDDALGDTDHMPNKAAIRSWERRASSLRRRTSLILRMLILGAGTPAFGKAGQANPAWGG